MRLFLNSVLAVGIAAALVVATPEARGKGQRRSGPRALTGCLQKGEQPNTYKLTDVGRQHRSVEVVEIASGVDLAAHVGHRVTITGTRVAPREAAAAEGAKGTKGERAERNLRADSVKMVSEKCP